MWHSRDQHRAPTLYLASKVHPQRAGKWDGTEPPPDLWPQLLLRSEKVVASFHSELLVSVSFSFTVQIDVRRMIRSPERLPTNHILFVICEAFSFFYFLLSPQIILKTFISRNSNETMRTSNKVWKKNPIFYCFLLLVLSWRVLRCASTPHCQKGLKAAVSLSSQPNQRIVSGEVCDHRVTGAAS